MAALSDEEFKVREELRTVQRPEWIKQAVAQIHQHWGGKRPAHLISGINEHLDKAPFIKQSKMRVGDDNTTWNHLEVSYLWKGEPIRYERLWCDGTTLTTTSPRCAYASTWHVLTGWKDMLRNEERYLPAMLAVLTHKPT
jgi:hypothetical protein